jgi:hypothetical protein
MASFIDWVKFHPLILPIKKNMCASTGGGPLTPFTMAARVLYDKIVKEDDDGYNGAHSLPVGRVLKNIFTRPIKTLTFALGCLATVPNLLIDRVFSPHNNNPHETSALATGLKAVASIFMLPVSLPYYLSRRVIYDNLPTLDDARRKSTAISPVFKKGPSDPSFDTFASDTDELSSSPKNVKTDASSKSVVEPSSLGNSTNSLSQSSSPRSSFSRMSVSLGGNADTLSKGIESEKAADASAALQDSKASLRSSSPSTATSNIVAANPSEPTPLVPVESPRPR